MGKGHKPTLFVLFTTILVDLIGFGMIIPLIPIYGHHFGASGLKLAIFGGVYAVMQFLFAPFWGLLSDRVGRRPVLLYSLAGSTVFYMVFGLAPNFWWLLISRILGGIFAANFSMARAYVADITTLKDRAKGMGLVGAATGIGLTIGPPLGGFACTKFGIPAPGIIASIICGINLIVAYFRLPESLPTENRAAREVTTKRSKVPIDFSKLIPLFKNPQLRLWLITLFATSFAFTMMQQTFALFVETKFNLDTAEAGMRTGIIFMCYGMIMILVQAFLLRILLKKYDESKLMLFGMILQAISLAALCYTPNFYLWCVLTVPIAFGVGLVSPNILALISKSVDSSQQGAVLGLSDSFGSLARSTAPFCGLLIFSILPELPNLTGSFVTTVIFLVCLKSVLSPSKSKTEMKLSPLTEGAVS